MTVSLDALDDAIFRRMNDVDFPVADVLEGWRPRRPSGLARSRSTWWSSAAPTSRRSCRWRAARGSGITLRFIEYMDVGATNGWRMDEVLPSAEVVELIRRELPLVQLDPSAPGETAERWGYARPDGQHDPTLGEIGVISSVTQAFCGDCNRPGCPPRAGSISACSRARAMTCALPRGGRIGRGDRRCRRRDLAGPKRPLFRTARQPAG